MKRFRLIRYSIYILVIGALFVARGTDVLDSWRERVLVGSEGQLILSGAQLAPDLTAVLIDAYRRDYPDLDVVVRGGGTAHALEDLLQGETDVAFLIREPSPQEHEIFRAATGDTIAYHTVAVGGIAFLQSSSRPYLSVDCNEVRALLRGKDSPRIERIYAPDPNTGLWASLGRQLWEGCEVPQHEVNVVFLADEKQVMEAVSNDHEALGVVSTISVDPTILPPGLNAVAVEVDPGESSYLPLREEIAQGQYPFYHYLYAGLRRGGDAQARKLVTYLTSDSGQRTVERAGYLPQRRVLREVHLSKKAVGER